jgi:hypothetical protein
MYNDVMTLEAAQLEVLVPVREVVFDTTSDANEFNIFVLGYTDPRIFMKDTDFQITYSFSTRKRISTKGVVYNYGAPDVPFRQLYDFLCTAYNGGERFVDTYFQRVFPRSPAGRQFKNFETMIRDAMNAEYFDRYMAAMARRTTKAGALHKATEKKLIRDFSVWKNNLVAKTLKEFNHDIRKEIIEKLKHGEIPLKMEALDETTIKARKDAGITSRTVFYATGQLIHDIQIDIRVPEESFAF